MTYMYFALLAFLFQLLWETKIQKDNTKKQRQTLYKLEIT
jgi:hypothetical protein